MLSKSHSGGVSPDVESSESTRALRILHVRQAETVHSSQLSQTTPSKSNRNRLSFDEGSPVAVAIIPSCKLLPLEEVVAAAFAKLGKAVVRPAVAPSDDVVDTRPLAFEDTTEENDDVAPPFHDRQGGAKPSLSLPRDVSAARYVSGVADFNGSLIRDDLMDFVYLPIILW